MFSSKHLIEFTISLWNSSTKSEVSVSQKSVTYAACCKFKFATQQSSTGQGDEADEEKLNNAAIALC